jgi:hypothetical protein
VGIKNNGKDAKQSLAEAFHHNDFKKLLAGLSRKLQKERRDLKKQFCGGLFHAFTIETKRRKLEAINELLLQDNFAKMANLAETYQHKWRVMLGNKQSHRLQTLVNDIVKFKKIINIDVEELQAHQHSGKLAAKPPKDVSL